RPGAGPPGRSPSSSRSSAPPPSHRRPPLPPPSSVENLVSTSSISSHRPFGSPPSSCESETPVHFLGGRTASKDISTCVTSRVTKREDTTIGRPIQPDDVGCRGGDSNPGPSDASGAPRSGYGSTLGVRRSTRLSHPDGPAHEPFKYKGCDRSRSTVSTERY